MKKISILVFTLTILLALECNAQDRKPIFIGLQPGITKEQFYDKGEFDVNIFPLVMQLPVTKQMDFRATLLANYHFVGENGFSDIGIFLIAPVFLKNKSNVNITSSGFYAGPLVGLGRNILNEHYTVTLGVEPGYMFPTDKRFTLTLGLQLGGSYFEYDNGETKWRNHFGF